MFSETDAKNMDAKDAALNFERSRLVGLGNAQIRIIPFGAATYFSVQKPFGSSMIGHRSERFCVFLPIFAGRDGEGNEQKLGEEWGQAKQWKFVLKNPSVNGRSHLGPAN